MCKGLSVALIAIGSADSPHLPCAHDLAVIRHASHEATHDSASRPGRDPAQ